MSPIRLAAIPVALALAAASGAHAADPTAALNRTFTEYTGTGPIGNNNLNDDQRFFWFKEQAGSFMTQPVQSWFLVWDPREALTATGTVTFDQPIVAIIIDQAPLQASGPVFGKVGVTYDYSNAAVGLEVADAAATSFAGNVLSLSWFASNPGDHIRVLTAVPEPASIALLLGGLGLVGWRNRDLARR
jgi:hypothetical protein